MNLFELSGFLSPVGGAFGSAIAIHAVAVHQHSSSSLASMTVGIVFGLASGIGVYLGLMHLAVGKSGLGADFSSWRAAALLGVGVGSPYLAAFFCFWVVRLVLHFINAA